MSKNKVAMQKTYRFRENYTKDYLHNVKELLGTIEEEVTDALDEIITTLYDARDAHRTIFIIGNGGSAATASHFAGDLSKATICEGFPRFKAIALTDNIPGMLAWANDKDYEDIFVEQLKNLFEPDDVVIGISGSGNSQNICKALDYANKQGGITIGFSGYDGGKVKQISQKNIHIPSYTMQQVEDLHLLLEHVLTSLIKEEQECSQS